MSRTPAALHQSPFLSSCKIELKNVTGRTESCLFRCDAFPFKCLLPPPRANAERRGGDLRAGWVEAGPPSLSCYSKCSLFLGTLSGGCLVSLRLLQTLQQHLPSYPWSGERRGPPFLSPPQKKPQFPISNNRFKQE